MRSKWMSLRRCGAWSDPTYVFWDSDSQSPFDRGPTNGVRCAKLSAPPAPALTSPITTLERDYSKERPVSDELFRIYASFYSYDAGDLAGETESVDDSPPFWRRETVSYRAAYGGVRIPAFLFLPRNAAPPYQTVVYFPASHALRARSTEGEIELRFLDFVVRSGRAVLYPIYEGTYQRRSKEAGEGPSERRDLKIKWAKDVRRSVDYLRSRKDVDPNRIAFYGLSLGAIEGPVFLALEDRFKTGVLLAGGFRDRKAAPEIEPLNFAPRVKMPVLLLGGRQDFMHPYETAQIPMFASTTAATVVASIGSKKTENAGSAISPVRPAAIAQFMAGTRCHTATSATTWLATTSPTKKCA